MSQVLKWEISNAPPSSSWNLHGSFGTPCVKFPIYSNTRLAFSHPNLCTRILRSSAPRPAHALYVRFEIPSYTFSALKVEQLKITGETYKPYKGIRGRAIGNVEWRW